MDMIKIRGVYFEDVSGLDLDALHECTEEDCDGRRLGKKFQGFQQLLPIVLDGKVVTWKCPYCRGTVKPIKETQDGN